jgi:glycosyltransferase involved in cell wall biosynthesis
MRIALLAPLPPEQTGIAAYASMLQSALQEEGIEVVTPLPRLEHDPRIVWQRVAALDWSGVDLVHAELGGGRLGEFHALAALRQHCPRLPLTATVHDPERLVWKKERLPWPFSIFCRLPAPFPAIATVCADPLTLREERRLAQQLTRIVTLTQTGAACLRARMRIHDSRKITVIAHGNRDIPEAPLPPFDPIRLLYFGFIYRGKGMEDLIDALAESVRHDERLRGKVRLTLAGGSAPEMAFGAVGNYLAELRARIVRQDLAALIDWKLDVPESGIPALLQAHHVVLLPYRESRKLALLGKMRGTSGVLSWANACGRGVITSNARAFAEEVAKGNGMVYPEGDVAALSERLLDLFRNPEQIARWAAQARKIGQQRAWKRIAAQFRDFFEQTLHNQGG